VVLNCPHIHAGRDKLRGNYEQGVGQPDAKLRGSADSHATRVVGCLNRHVLDNFSAAGFYLNIIKVISEFH
jgi:hypothetical protein